jgi:hypothetical protein
MGPGSRFACPGRRWGLLYFGVIASASEAIHVSASRIRRINCFVAFASLRKRFAFVAGNDIGVVPAEAGTHNHGCLCRTEPPHQCPQRVDVGGYGSRIALRLSGTTAVNFRQTANRVLGTRRARCARAGVPGRATLARDDGKADRRRKESDDRVRSRVKHDDAAHGLAGFHRGKAFVDLR